MSCVRYTDEDLEHAVEYCYDKKQHAMLTDLLKFRALAKQVPAALRKVALDENVSRKLRLECALALLGSETP